MNYEKLGTPVVGGGLQYLISLDIQHQHSDDGLDLRTMDKHLALAEMDHWSLYGLMYYVMQSI